MMKGKSIALATAAALVVAGCSSKPRQFRPVLGAAPADEAAFSAAAEDCRTLIASHLDRKGRLASGAAGAAAGIGAGAVGAAATSGTYASVGGAMAAAGTVIVAVPVVSVLGAWGLAKARKSKKERAIKTATATCLADKGYQVQDWEVAKKRRGRESADSAATTRS